MQEDFSYKVYLTDAIGGFVYGKDRTRWAEAIKPLYERERLVEEEEINPEEFKASFVQRFNKEVKNNECI